MADEEDIYSDEEFDDEELEQQEPGPIRKFLQNVLKGSAIGAGLGGAGGYYGAKYLRDLTMYGAAPNSWTPEFIRELNVPTDTARAVTVPSGVALGGLLGALGGATLPYIFQKSGNEHMNKYANTFLQNLKDQIKQLRPFDQAEAILKIAPVTAILGSAGGGLLGAMGKQEVDEEGNPKSKVPSILRGMSLGAVLGGTAGALTPTIGTYAAEKALPYFVNYANKKLDGQTSADALSRIALANVIGMNLIKKLPEHSIGDLYTYYKQVAGKD